MNAQKLSMKKILMITFFHRQFYDFFFIDKKLLMKYVTTVFWYTKINYWIKDGIKVAPKAAQIAKVITKNQSLFQGSTIIPHPCDMKPYRMAHMERPFSVNPWPVKHISMKSHSKLTIFNSYFGIATNAICCENITTFTTNFVFMTI